MSQISYDGFEDISRDGFQDEYVRFSGRTESYCIGFVDVVDSTKFAAKIHPSKLGTYYSIFLNHMSRIAKKFGAVVVKNMGDSILFYFPLPVNEKTLEQIIRCGMKMVEERCSINKKLFQEKLPSISYRISLDYGTVSMATSSSSSVEDVFGPPVNVCAKINHSALPNGMVVGSDLYRMIMNLPGYEFVQICSFSSGLRSEYPVYSILRKFKDDNL